MRTLAPACALCTNALQICIILDFAGQYQSMISGCQDSQGQCQCFYKGWPDMKDASLHPFDESAWHNLMNPCYAQDLTCGDAVHAVTVLGAGSPNQEKWFWTSRNVYLELEPAWLYMMSASEWRMSCQSCCRAHDLPHGRLCEAWLHLSTVVSP